LDRFGMTVIFTWYATVIAATVVAFPLMYKTTLGAFKQIDRNLLASARTLGASEWTVFWRVLLPLAKPGLIAGTLLSFARSSGEFGATLMLAGSIPGKTQTIPVAIFFAAESGAMDEALVWVLALLAISLGVIWAVHFWSEDKQRIRNSTGWLEKTRKLRYPSASKFKIQHFNFPRPSFNSPTIEPQSSAELFVDIRKQLPGFLLDVTFETRGEPLGVLGASGAGKSVMLRCIAGLERPDEGRIVLNGRVLFDRDRGIDLPSCDRRIGVLFQNYALFPHLTVAENIAFGLPKGLSRLAAKQRVEAQLAAIQLQGMGNRFPRQLSGGQQQRVALARALASEPEALLFDEPLSALDTHLRYQIEKLLIASLARYSGATLFVTHNLEEAYRVCPALLVVEGGKLAAQGPKQEIFTHPRTLSVAQLTGCKNFSPAIAIAPHQVQAVNWGCALHVAEPIPKTLSHVGLRAHQIAFAEASGADNTFPCWLTAKSETPHRMTLYLKLNSAPTSPHDYHLQAEVFKDKWETIKDRPFPWFAQLDPARLLLLSDTREARAIAPLTEGLPVFEV
ncbi:MAG: ATP-binding cassette domain-containing protein, partial [Cyanobacteriota bacterium]|nr:ATP-binding cassette domain-containing protein [Cyanobacteriota bacterium]